MNERYVRPSSDRIEKVPGKKKKTKYGSMLMELEQRIAFDAAGAATVEKSQEKSHQDQADHGDAPAESHEAARDGHDALVAALADHQAASAAPDASAVATQPRQVVVIDSTVPDYDALVKDLGQDFKVIVVDPNENGVHELAETLSSMHDVEAIHIIPWQGRFPPAWQCLADDRDDGHRLRRRPHLAARIADR